MHLSFPESDCIVAWLTSCSFSLGHHTYSPVLQAALFDFLSDCKTEQDLFNKYFEARDKRAKYLSNPSIPEIMKRSD